MGLRCDKHHSNSTYIFSLALNSKSHRKWVQDYTFFKRTENIMPTRQSRGAHHLEGYLDLVLSL